MDHATNMIKLFKYISKGRVFIFSKSYCPYCKDAKDLFSTLGVKYDSVEVDKSNDFSSTFINYLNQHAKIKTFPKIYIGEDCIGGYTDAQKLLNNMKIYDKLKAQNIDYIDT